MWFSPSEPQEAPGKRTPAQASTQPLRPGGPDQAARPPSSCRATLIHRVRGPSAYFAQTIAHPPALVGAARIRKR